MAYLRFASTHSDYFSVMFNSGIDKSKYPEVQRSARDAFGIILSLAHKLERTPKLAQERAISAWAFVPGLAAPGAHEALFTAAGQQAEWEYFQPILQRFLDQSYA